METILIKILAAVLALSQVATRPDDVKTKFDAASDRGEVIQLLRDGCAHMRKAFEIEDLPLDDLVATAMADPQAVGGDIPAFRGLNFGDLHRVYRQLCTDERFEIPAFDVGAVIAFYNKSAADLPDHTRLKGLQLPGPTQVLDGRGRHFGELYEAGNRRIPIPLGDVPKLVQQAFIAAEDKRFFHHHGIDERGLVRAFVANMMHPGRPQGGSTITQQVVKNLLVGDDVTYERKIREMIVTSRVERTLTKAEILQLYLNSIYFGRNAWGIEMAARSYFGKSARELSLAEGALLAGLVKGPNYFSPDRAPDRARERLAYVLGRMHEDQIITADQMKQAQDTLPPVVPFEPSRPDHSPYFFDYLSREAKTLTGLPQLAEGGYTLRATILPDLQRATEAALQEGLAQYEMRTGRVDFQGPEANLSEAIRHIRAEGDPSQPQAKPDWRRALEAAHLPLFDVHWQPAVVLDKQNLRVGLKDGRILPLRAASHIQRRLQIHDVVLVRVIEGDIRAKTAARAELRVRPLVQGAAIVIENKTGRIRAMVGGFSYALSQLNRAAQTRRQPGSAIKPLIYLAALRKGLQPNTLVRDTLITLPPVGAGTSITRDRDYWTPKNYDGASSGVMTLRRALENSRNLATVGLLDGVIDITPELSLERVCELAEEAQLYSQCLRVYPVVLGAQPVRLIDLAAFYAAVANEGGRPQPHAIEAIEQNGRTIYRDNVLPLAWLGSADRVAFYQLKSILQGVVQRGTASAIKPLAPYVAGKTGTTDDENDAWFIGFTNDVTVGVWVGYDNANSRRTLGAGQTGGKVAVPIFESIIKAVWAYHSRQTPLSPPSPEARRYLAALPIDPYSGSRLSEGGDDSFREYFRLDPQGRLNDTQYKFVTPEEAENLRDQIVRDDQYLFGADSYGRDFYGRNDRAPPWAPGNRAYPEPAPFSFFRGLFGEPHYGPYDAERGRQRRIDPDYFWHGRRYN